MTTVLNRRADAALDHAPYLDGLTAPAHVLDALAMDALAVVLGQRAADSLLDADRRQALAALLFSDPLDDGPLRRRAALIAGRFLMTRPQALDSAGARLVARGAGGRPGPGEMLSLGLARLRRGRQGNGRFGAEPLAQALARSRWSGAGFRKAAATLLRDVLRHEVVFHPGPAPAPLLAPALWWVLVAGLLPPPPEPRRFRRPRRDPLHEAIRAQAARALAETRWLGFWELYLLRGLPTEARAALPPGLRNMLARDAAQLAAITAKEIEETPLLRVDWPDTVPSYAPWLPWANH
jgi:hypothetical protein